MNWFWIILMLVVLQRLGELCLARRNTRRLLARGAHEVAAGHYPAILALHVAWLLAMAVTIPGDTEPNWLLLGLFLLLQAGRLWTIVSLGPYWTTRIVTLPGAPLVRRGPYRFLAHPNYLIVACEIAVLPLAFGTWKLALAFSLLNAVVLVQRIGAEDAALAERRRQAGRQTANISSPPT